MIEFYLLNQKPFNMLQANKHNNVNLKYYWQWIFISGSFNDSAKVARFNMSQKSISFNIQYRVSQKKRASKIPTNIMVLDTNVFQTTYLVVTLLIYH